MFGANGYSTPPEEMARAAAAYDEASAELDAPLLDRAAESTPEAAALEPGKEPGKAALLPPPPKTPRKTAGNKRAGSFNPSLAKFEAAALDQPRDAADDAPGSEAVKTALGVREALALAGVTDPQTVERILRRVLGGDKRGARRGASIEL